MTRLTVSFAAAIALSVAVAVPAMAAAHITMAQARHEIMGDGYTGVSDLRKTKAGWEAKALESGEPVTVLVTGLGDVAKVQ
jgi:hypothetical protein